MESQPTLRRAIANKYTVAARLESHGSSRLYRATQADTGRLVALRELVPAHCAPEEALRRMTRLAAVSSRFLVDVVDAGPMDEGHVYVAHALLDGESLTERLARKNGLTAPEAAALCVRVLKGLSSLHKRELVHGGLRPSRVFHERVRTGGWHIKVLGAAVPSVTRAESAAAVELVRYAPPEWLAGDEWSPRGDVYSLAALLFEVMTNRPVFEGADAAAVHRNVMTGLAADLRAAMPGASSELQQLIADGLALDPSARPENADAMLERLLVLYPEPERGSDAVVPKVEHWTRGGVVARPAGAALELPPVPESRTAIARRTKRAVRSTAVTTAAVTAICTAGIGAALYLRAQRRASALESQINQQSNSAPAATSTVTSTSATTTIAPVAPAVVPASIPSVASTPTPSAPSVALAADAGTSAAGVASASNVASATGAHQGTASGAAPTHVAAHNAHGAHPAGASSEPAATSQATQDTAAPAAGAPTMGTLEFRTVTACSFVLDGRLYGRLSMTELNLAPGRHQITCHSSTSTQQLIVRVYAGQRTRVRVGSTGEAEIMTEPASPSGT